MTDSAPAIPVGREERRALLAAAAGHFLLLCGYYMLRPIREALALQVGVQNNYIMFAVVLLCSAILLPGYWWLVARTPRGRVLWYVCTPFAFVFISLAVGLSWFPRDRTLAFVYFVALTTTNLYLISVFWSAMSDVWRPELAKRFYGYVAAGGSAGAICGPLIVSMLIGRTGPTPLIILACAIIMATALLASVARRSLRGGVWGRHVLAANVPVGGRAIDDLRRLAKSPYLLGIAGLIITGQTIGAFMYNEQGKYVASLYSTIAERAEVFANLELAVNILSLLFQVAVVGWLTRRGSLRLSLSAMPAVLGICFVVLAMFPVAAVFLATQVARRAADYGLGKPTREMLFTILNPESKFKSKSLIDTVLQRGADIVGQLLYVAIAGIGLAGISWVCAVICIVLLAATRSLGKTFDAQQHAAALPETGR